MLGCQRTLPAQVPFVTHPYPQVLFCRAAPNASIPQSVLVLGTAHPPRHMTLRSFTPAHSSSLFGSLSMPSYAPAISSKSMYIQQYRIRDISIFHIKSPAFFVFHQYFLHSPRPNSSKTSDE